MQQGGNQSVFDDAPLRGWNGGRNLGLVCIKNFCGGEFRAWPGALAISGSFPWPW